VLQKYNLLKQVGALLQPLTTHPYTALRVMIVSDVMAIIFCSTQVLDGAQQVQDSFAGLNSELCPELRGWLPGFVQHCREKVSQLKHESDILQYSQQRGLV
jgi:hypothetical protein